MTEQDQPAGAASPPPENYEQYQPPEAYVSSPPGEVELDPGFSYGPPTSSYPPATTHLLVGDSSGGSGTRATRRSGALVGVVGILVAGVVSVGIFGSVQDAGDTFDSFTDDFESGEFFSGETPDVFTASGYADVVAAVRSETGSTDVFDLVLYPEYAVVTVPAGDSGGRALSYFWDGELQQTSKSTSQDTRFDLAVIDADVVLKLISKARRQLVDDPTTSYVIIRSPRDSAEGAWLYAYAQNEFSETGYLAATLDGAVVSRYQSTSE